MIIKLNQVNDTKIRPEDDTSRTRQQNIDAILSLGKLLEPAMNVDNILVGTVNDKIKELIKTL